MKVYRSMNDKYPDNDYGMLYTETADDRGTFWTGYIIKGDGSKEHCDNVSSAYAEHNFKHATTEIPILPHVLGSYLADCLYMEESVIDAVNLDVTILGISDEEWDMLDDNMSYFQEDFVKAWSLRRWIEKDYWDYNKEEF